MISPYEKIGYQRQQVVLVGDVVVERHRLEAESSSKFSHAQRIETTLVDQVEGGCSNPVT